MSNHPWLEALRGDLMRQGLPADYVARLVQELEDHVEDLFLEQENCMHTEVPEKNPSLRDGLEQRLGSREQLMDRAVAEYRQRTFTGRHPVWIFLIAPIPAAIVCWALFFPLASLVLEGMAFVLGSGLGLIHEPAEEWPQAFIWAVRNLHLLSAFIPPAIVILIWHRLFRHSGRTKLWGIASCLLIALIAGLYVTRLVLPTADTKGNLQVGFGLTTSPTLQQVAQFVLPLALGSYLVIRAGRGSKALSLDRGQ
jgi:hypothetical protein